MDTFNFGTLATPGEAVSIFNTQSVAEQGCIKTFVRVQLPGWMMSSRMSCVSTQVLGSVNAYRMPAL